MVLLILMWFYGMTRFASSITEGNGAGFLTALITGLLVGATGLLTTFLNNRSQAEREQRAREAQRESGIRERRLELRTRRQIDPIIEYLLDFLASFQIACMAVETGDSARVGKAAKNIEEVRAQQPVAYMRALSLRDSALLQTLDLLFNEGGQFGDKWKQGDIEGAHRAVLLMTATAERAFSRLLELEVMLGSSVR